VSTAPLHPPGDDTQPIPVVRGRHAAPRPKRSLSGWALLIGKEVGIIAAIAVAALIIIRLAVGSIAHVADDAMEPALSTGDRVIVTTWGTPAVGDIVLVRSPQSWGSPTETAIARVVGTGGQQVTCCDEAGRIVVDGVPIDEPYLAGATDQVDFDVVVPQGRVFVLADRRDAARDSRARLDVDGGTVAADDVLGRVVFVVWPPRGPVN
jgi:signal peptidase I